MSNVAKKPATYLPFYISLMCLVALSGAILWSDSSDPTQINFFADPYGRTLTIFVLFILLVAVVATFGKARRMSRKAIWTSFTFLLAVLTFTFGFGAYWNAGMSNTPFWTALAWTVSLFVGNVEGAGGATPVSLTLETARLVGILTAFSTAIQIIFYSTRNMWDRLIVDFYDNFVVLIGVDKTTLPLVKSLVNAKADAETRGGRKVVVVYNNDEDSVGLDNKIRAAGGLVYAMRGLNELPRLRRLLINRKFLSPFKPYIAPRTVYILNTQPNDALDWYRATSEILETVQPRQGTVHRVLVRIDDPWGAETWRRDAVLPHTKWLVDALSVYELSARSVLSSISKEPAKQLIVTGRSPLTLAIAMEHAQRRREAQVRTQALKDNPECDKTILEEDDRILMMKIKLVHPEADKDKQYLEAIFSRYDSSDSDWLEAELVTPQDYFHKNPTDSNQTAIVLAAKPGTGTPDLAHRLTATMPHTRIYSWMETQQGLADLPLVGNLYPLGVGIAWEDYSFPADRWTLLARLVHEQYLRNWVDGRPGPHKQSAQNWDNLSDFYRMSNVRQVGRLLATARKIGWTWSFDMDIEGDTTTPNFDEITPPIVTLAKAEHESWLEYYKAHGWKYSPATKNSHDSAYAAAQRAIEMENMKLNECLRDWDEMYTDPHGEKCIKKPIEGVKDLLKTMSVAGYHVRCPVDYKWHEYRMTQQVNAERLTEPRDWVDSSGGKNRGEAGDWWVHDNGENGRSVKPDIFEKTYRLVKDDIYQRVGVREARRAYSGEIPQNPEVVEPVPAREGQWLLCELGDREHTWLVDDEYFRNNYELN